MSFVSNLLCCFNQRAKAANPNEMTPAQLRAALVKICGKDQVALPGEVDPPFLHWASPYNLDRTVAVTPSAIVRPKDAEQVAAVVEFAAEHAYKVQAKSGGHSYANFGLGGPGAINFICVDLARLRGVSVDKASLNATIGAGALLGDVTKKLDAEGGRAFAHGVCPGVGIGGHATIGGLGPMSRMWGAALDHIVEAEVVTADGKILRVSDTQNTDLFFAIRGAGASFGIVTEFVMRTHPEPSNVAQYAYTFAFGEHDIAEVFRSWQDIAYDPSVDRRLGTMYVLTAQACIIEVIFYGTKEEYEASGIPDRLPRASDVAFVLNGWKGHLAHLAESGILFVSNLHIPFYNKSLGFRQQDKLSDELIEETFRYLAETPKGIHEAFFLIFSAQGGAINDVGPAATAYAHRDKVMFYEDYLVNIPVIDEVNRHFVLGFHALMKKALVEPKTATTAYPGYVDLELGPGPISGPAYWGENYPRLQQLKTKWDPQEVFYNAQSVRPLHVVSQGGPAEVPVVVVPAAKQ